MKNNFSKYLIYLILFTITVLTSESFAQSMTFKKVRIVLTDRTSLRAHDVVINWSIRTVSVSPDRQYSFSELESLEYSNEHAGLIGMSVGGITAFLIAKVVSINGTISIGHLTIGSAELSQLLALPLGMYLGYRVGSSYFHNWQEYTLSNDHPPGVTKTFGPPSKTMFLRWKIPLFRIKPF